MNPNGDREELAAFLAAAPEVDIFEAILPDLNGRLRGKWIPRSNIEKAIGGGLKLPLSTLAFDIWGRDAEGRVFQRGDFDGVCKPVTRSLATVPWLERPTAQFLMSLEEGPGSPCEYDPRHLLRRLVSRLERDHGLVPVVACEMEFYLFGAECDETGRPQLMKSAGVNPAIGGQTYGIEVMEEIAGFMHAVRDACRVQSLPLDTLIAESGPSQFEINLCHQPDALLSADQAVLLRRAIKGVAAGFGLRASFMAKPLIDRAGNGMHVHCSLVDGEGKNVFDDGSARGSHLLHRAVGGCLFTMAECMLLFAPNRNSYRRFQPGAHAPMAPAWGYDNRTVAVRIPSGDSRAMRLEHRVPGGDANPYLVTAAILAGILAGLEQQLPLPDPVPGNAYAQCDRSLPSTWRDALSAFRSAESVRDYLGPEFQTVFGDIKRQEIDEFDRDISSLEYRTYL